MSDEDVPVTEERTAEDAFEALADETRLSVLRTLVEADAPLSFTELRERTGVADSGRFNYHLSALRDAFVRQTEEGLYTVTHAGHSIVGAILAGRLTAGVSVEPRQVDGTCVECGGPLEASYEDTFFEVTCRECSQGLVRSPIPPAIIRDHAPDYAAAAWRYTFISAAQMRAGFCHVCEGPITERFFEPDETFPEDEELAVTWTCERCGSEMRNSLTAVLAHDATVRSFLADHGVDPATDSPWERTWLYAQSEVDVVAEDPKRVRARLELDEEALVVRLDEDVQISHVERTSVA